MQYTRLGNTGLPVSRLALGCMSYGDPATADAHRGVRDLFSRTFAIPGIGHWAFIGFIEDLFGDPARRIGNEFVHSMLALFGRTNS